MDSTIERNKLLIHTTMQHAEWKKSVSQGHILCDSAHITFSKWQNYRDGEQIHGCQGRGRVGGEEGGGAWTEQDEEQRGMMQSVGNFVFFFFSGPHLQHMEIPRLGVESELRLPAYIPAHGNARSPAHWARPGIEPATSQILVGFVTTEPQQELQFCILIVLVVTWIHMCDKMAQNYIHTLHQCQFPGGYCVIVTQM